MNSGGSTPTIVTGVSLTRTTEPITSGSAAEPQSPALLADHGNGLGCRRVVVRHDGAARASRDAECAIVVAGRKEGRRDVGLAVDHEIDVADRRKGEEIRQRAVVVDELPVHGVRERGIDTAAVRILRRKAVDEGIGPHLVAAHRAQSNQPVGVGDWHLPEQQAVHRAEQRGVGADAERQRDKDDRRPAPGLQHHPRGESKVSDHGRRLE